MELRFKDEGHIYESISDPKRDWLGVTTLIKKFYEDFNGPERAAACSVNKKSKWYGLTPEKILELWEYESKRSNTMGSGYHNEREAETLACETIRREGVDLPVFRPIMDGEYKLSPNQQLVPGIYPEHFMYLKSASICGQADRVEVIGDRVDIYDYKTNKELKMRGYKYWDGRRKMMYPPLQHLEDCDFIHYCLQLSIYMYIVLKHNHQLRPGKIQIQHTLFKVKEKDQYGFPIHELDSEGKPVVDKVTLYDIKYMKREVNAMLKHLKMNPQLRKK